MSIGFCAGDILAGAVVSGWQYPTSLKFRSCRKGRYAPPVHMLKLTETREITPYKWVHPER